MKIPFHIGNDPLTYIVQVEEEAATPKHLTGEPRTARQIFMQEVQQK